MRAVLPARRVKVLQLGPALTVRGGITTVEQHICDYLAPYVSLRHVATMDQGSALSRAAVYARAVRTLRRALESIEPCIVHIHFASRGSTLRKLILASLVTRAGRPLVLHAHGGYFDQFHRRLPAFLRRIVNSVLQRANVVIALSPRWRDFYINECELSPAQVAVLPNPVRWSPDVPSRSGRLAGDGDLEAIRRLAAPFGEQVRVLSWVGNAEREQLLAQSDVFALPSYNEGVPMSLLEAMAAGLPSIVTSVGGIPDVLRHGVEGLMVEPARVAELSAAMARMVNDEGERLATGRRAHERARAYDVHGYARRLADIYLRIAPVAEMREMA
jgi:glycosyltransferase involved in cell wall biosynthesis